MYELADQLDAGTYSKVTVYIDGESTMGSIDDIHGGFRGINSPGVGRPKVNTLVLLTYSAFQAADAATTLPKQIETDCQGSYDRANYYQQGTRSAYKFIKKLRELSTYGSGTTADPYRVIMLKRTKNQPEPRMVMISQTYCTALGL